jgi:O-methyltransferase domain/Dimerisation domain
MAHDPSQIVVELIFGRWRSQILYAGVKLGIFDALSRGAQSASHLAEALHLDPALTYRLLRALASLGLLHEDAHRSFTLTACGAYLQGDHPQTLRGVALLEEGPEHYAAWKHLCTILRDGQQDGFVREFGRPMFVHAVEEPGYGAVFNAAMSSYAHSLTPMVLEALAPHDFSTIAHVCDVGGGHGHLLCSLLTQYATLRGTVYDLASVIADADRLWAPKMGVSERCAYVAGDMFRDVPTADAYLLKSILHDWNDAECVQILTNMCRAAPRHARAFVAEFVVPGPDTPHFAKLFDTHMMCVLTGRERTEDEYAALFHEAGWRYVQTRYPVSRLLGVIEAVKA